MDGAELLATKSSADLGVEVRARIQDEPAMILRLATAIADNRGQWPASAVTRACTEELELVTTLSATAIVAELEACLLGRDVDQALQWLQNIGFIALHLPELEATSSLQQEPGRHHKDVWDHTKLVVRQAVKRPAVRWAALLHDIGKVPTRRFTAKGVHFHGHAEVGARMFDKMSKRLPFPNDKRRKIRFLIKHHLRSNQYSADWTDNAVRRFAREMDAHLIDLMDLSRADITSKRPGRRQALLRQISELGQRIQTLRAQDAKLPPLPKGVGTALMKHFSLKPSRFIGDLKRNLEAAIERGELEERREDEYYVKWVEDSGLVPDDSSES